MHATFLTIPSPFGGEPTSICGQILFVQVIQWYYWQESPGQQQGIELLTALAMVVFYRVYSDILAQWGMKLTHQGTCPLLPGAWNGLSAAHLSQIFEVENCPKAGFARMTYRYADHAVSSVRAVAWFSQAQSTGAILDDFMGMGHWKPMDASHTCHHDNCIIHVTYEFADINQDRKDCCKRAKAVRRAGRTVPHHCTKHNLYVWCR